MRRRNSGAGFSWTEVTVNFGADQAFTTGDKPAATQIAAFVQRHNAEPSEAARVAVAAVEAQNRFGINANGGPVIVLLTTRQ